MKKIVITQRLIENDSYYEIRDCLDIRWSAFLRQLGYLPILLPSHFNFKTYFKELKVEGIILSGGNDLGSLSGKKIDNYRDGFERDLISLAIENNIPLLGVCRGMQIIGDYFGMKLVKLDNHVAVRHMIDIKRNTPNRSITQEPKEVNSYHNFGFRRASDDFTIIAKTEDGIIEAMEHKKYPILTMMWHPEREEVFCKNDIGMIKNFFEKSV